MSSDTADPFNLGFQEIHRYEKIREKIRIDPIHLLGENQEISMGLIIRGHRCFRAKRHRAIRGFICIF